MCFYLRKSIVFLLIIFIFVTLKIYANKEEERTLKKTLILCLHDIDGEGKYSITKEEFIKILDLLKNDYQVLSLEDFYLSKKNKKNNKPAVILTFDDGFTSVFDTIIPLLREYNYGATFFIYLNRYDDTSSFYKKLTLLEDKFEIGSHTLSHDNAISYWETDISKFYKEIYLSKKKLEYLTKRDVVSFAWPYGKYTKDMYEYVKKAGYKIQVSTDYGLAENSLKEIIIKRLTVQQPEPVEQVKGFLKYYSKKKGAEKDGS
ncbi:MAG: polysaccharide deacetylase family protein [Spirochaetia bacterium]|nr:polysaccharide deacetylase family protein [Spirochaetia bacterium]